MAQQGRLLAMQQRKRHADHDALLLQNRISLLRKEEAKAWKKIETTKQRSEEILRLREQNERRVVERISAAERQADNCKLQNQRNQAVEETARLNRIRIYHELAAARKNSVAQVRQKLTIGEGPVQSPNRTLFSDNTDLVFALDNEEKVVGISVVPGQMQRFHEARQDSCVKEENNEYSERNLGAVFRSSCFFSMHANGQGEPERPMTHPWATTPESSTGHLAPLEDRSLKQDSRWPSPNLWNPEVAGRITPMFYSGRPSSYGLWLWSDIKQREEEARNARLEGRARLVEESRRSYEDRVRREEDEIAAREQEVARMEQKELSLIQQLKNTQALQQRAYQELEAALGDSRAMAAKPFPVEHVGDR
ncbi:conserved unknown protein [Ectocarpus siliculosus]|uniref:Uncharacterized protein n=1 Tax=Ectocarpus siliculosus TaxID=2880 RepID=D8LMA0_ECTSI|nr:conserved unknown protein [Ectocarpus siliculosus]|eukprot:CBN77510.1 conserved unknown protein [Ectocarpus siliculosus]